MTIRDMIEQGIEIQGAYKIQKYDDKKEGYVILEIGDDFRYEKHNEEILDMELKYIYPVPIEGTILARIIFEVEEKED